MAYDHSFSKKNLIRHILKSEIGIIPQANRDSFRETLGQNSFLISDSYLRNCSVLSKITISKKTAYTVPLLEHQLIVRKLNQNLKKSFKSHEKNRNSIIRRLNLFLQETIPYNIYRLDIANFYESINQDYLLKLINQNYYLCNHSKGLVSEIFNQFNALNGTGIPRGVMISSPLAELTMSSFDKEIAKDKDVFFFQRYVDDIIIITSGREDINNFQLSLERKLPLGLTFNKKKSKILKIRKNINKGEGEVILGNFDYLGYNFSVYSNKSKSSPRKVEIQISANKINKIKSKIIRSFISFKKDQNFNLLIDRIRFLSSNFSFYDRKKGKNKIAGIYFSYPLLTNDIRCLNNLDNYYRHIILSPNGFLHLNIYSSLTSHQKRELLKISFSKGYSEKIFNNFSGVRINKIQECWNNV
ncbi:antiviral reverse transcriptase Drt3a [Acinetobacter johnsonii]|uniref:antiviral reverse transcriptase Drt3a n=1 Tax=Acinetobacter johnsonii TaxID=40214 RepID=UPI0021E3C1E4|nr:antiviral reverse transcriptase Drt3a [Acinetobacter johnsonii]MCV2451591.1 RNA-directed DNA polymerase [Acinetobacter johnsonii]